MRGNKLACPPPNRGGQASAKPSSGSSYAKISQDGRGTESPKDGEARNTRANPQFEPART